MTIVLAKSVQLIKDNKNIFENLEGSTVKEIHNNFNNMRIQNNHLIQDYTILSKDIYTAKDVCIEYIENISEPSLRVPNDKDYRYLIKENGKYFFIKDNPKPMEVNATEYLQSRVGSNYQGEGIIAEELYTYNNNYKVYSLPYGGIDKGDSSFFYVDTVGIIRNLDSSFYVDYVEGIIYSTSSLQFKFIFSIFNLVPMKILPKGSIKIEESDDNFYKICNVPVNNQVTFQYFSDQVLVLTTLRDIIISIPDDSQNFSIDGTVIQKNQKIFLKRNEKIVVEKINDNVKNIEYLSSNTKLVESLAEGSHSSYIHIDSNKDIKTSGYFLDIIEKEALNTYKKTTPIRLKLF